MESPRMFKAVADLGGMRFVRFGRDRHNDITTH